MANEGSLTLTNEGSLGRDFAGETRVGAAMANEGALGREEPRDLEETRDGEAVDLSCVALGTMVVDISECQ